MDIQSVNAPAPYNGNYSQNVRFWAHHYAAGTGGTPRMFIQYDGKVGIGTTSPGAILVVQTGSGTSIPSLGSSGGHFQLQNGTYGLLAGVSSAGYSWMQAGRTDGTATAYDLVLQSNGGNVAIGKTSANAKLDVYGNTIVTGSLTVTGSISVTGKLNVTDTVDSTDAFGLKTFTKSLTLTTSWLDTGISGSDLATGTYILQVLVDNYDVSGGQYTEYYSGVMSWFATGTNSTDYDEIVLHKAGHAPNGNWINLRTLRQSNPGTLKLQIIANGNTSGADNYIFKFRRMI